MAKKEKTKFNYSLELRQLRENGPERLYLLYGEEDYLRERFVDELKKLCLSDEADFNYKRLDGPSIDLNDLAQAVDAIPFFSDRSFVEVRGFDINKCRDADCERLKSIVSDIPDYCTVAVMTLNGETITSCYLDAVQANVNFDASGAIVNELSADVASKNTLGDDYGMHAYSSIGADWHTQAASFSSYVTGKTVAEVAGIAVAEGKATDADLSSSVTMGIGDFLELIAKAG